VLLERVVLEKRLKEFVARGPEAAVTPGFDPQPEGT
jgi:hypothetical protein